MICKLGVFFIFHYSRQQDRPNFNPPETESTALGAMPLSREYITYRHDWYKVLSMMTYYCFILNILLSKTHLFIYLFIYF